MTVSPPLPSRSMDAAMSSAMRAATRAYERARRAKVIVWTALGGGGVAVAAAVASGVAGFLIAKRLRRR